MKKTQRKDALRNIKKRIISFLSLILIVFLGIMGFFAAHYMGADMKSSTLVFYRNQNFKDVIMTSSLGVGESEVTRLKALPEVRDAEGVTLLAAQLSKGSQGASVTMLTRTERISLPQVVEGRLPEGESELALGYEAMRRLELKVGDIVSLEVTDPLLPDCLKQEDFTVVGKIIQPEYLRKSRTTICMVHPLALDENVTMESFTRVYIKLDLPEGMDLMSPSYLEETARKIPAIQDLSESLGLTRLDSLKNRALNRVDLLNLEVFQPLKNALQSMTLDQMISNFVEDPEELVPLLRDFSQKLRNGGAQDLQEIISAITPESLAQILPYLTASTEEIGKQVHDIFIKIADFIDSHIGMVEKVVRGTNWVILDNRSDEGYLDMQSNISACRGISVAYGGLFGLVSMLVCFSTLTIIISEQGKQIGATKAFGFYSREVFGKYLIFGEGAAIIGTVLGILVGDILGRIVINNYIKSFEIIHMVRQRSLLLPGLIFLASILSIALASYIACKRVLKRPAAALISGAIAADKQRKAAVKGGRSGKSSLYSRLIFRNMISELPRVIISVIIIAGSLIIMGVGFSLKSSTEEMIRRQQDEINLYDYQIKFSQKITGEQLEDVKNKLTDAGYDYLEAANEMHIFESIKGQEALNLIAVPGDDFGRFMSIRDPKSGQALSIPRDGAIIQLRMSEVYQLKSGDSVLIRDNNLGEHTMEIRGIFNNYQGRLMLTSWEAYEKILGDKPKVNSLYLLRRTQEADETVLKQLPEGMFAEDKSAFVSRYAGFLKLYDVIVLALTGMSVLLSFLILANLTNIFVSRKKRELIIMRVNGFSFKENVGYLCRETLVTTFFGVVLGIGAGILVARMIISMLELPDVQLVRQPIVKAWVLATLLELLFAFIINFLAFRKMKDYQLSEIAEA